ncbi:hypothetical protein Sphch_0159 [Sphingobium chlorophenolicum L-1]|uniref:Uncharacterized protein n=1 Tax=Sphingobium chlorophenolicum L-1 TaxID=690566 RepID=F6EUG6_SPHCR|nr:hypothetical protein [Sphingobium chlorophenolicum]AEG47860.1 hypothetical protein Sphch_0159 [Sphingobium chlorophenolicum L-1]
MTANLTRLAVLHGALMILTGLIIAGFPLVMLVARDSYGYVPAFDPGGDYRAWLMAHLEGLLNGLLVIALTYAAALRPSTKRRATVIFWSLLAMGWGNTMASILAPIFTVRAMTVDGSMANDLIFGIFGIGFVGTLIAFYTVIRQLADPRSIPEIDD